MTKVAFARINRRNEAQDVLSSGQFDDEILTLSRSYRTQFLQTRRVKGKIETRNWIAADMSLDPSGSFLSGTLGFSETAERRLFDERDWSWIKAPKDEFYGAADDAVVPFAVDIRPRNRWVAFATSYRLRQAAFCEGLSLVLNQAVSELGLIPQQWDVDLVTSRARIDRWVYENPYVYRFQRTVKFPNPGLDLDDDRRRMQALAATRKKEEYAAAPNQVLNVDSAEFREGLDGTENGNLDIRLWARSTDGGKGKQFDSSSSVDSIEIDSFGPDLMRGMELVLRELSAYVNERDGGRR